MKIIIINSFLPTKRKRRRFDNCFDRVHFIQDHRVYRIKAIGTNKQYHESFMLTVHSNERLFIYNNTCIERAPLDSERKHIRTNIRLIKRKHGDGISYKKSIKSAC